MTRALVTQMLEVLESTTYNGPKMGKAIKAAREYLATEPSGERAELIADLRRIAAEGMADYASTGYLNSNAIRKAADMLEADVSIINEGNKAQQATDPSCPSCQSPGLMYECVYCSANSYPKGFAQQAKRVPMTDAEKSAAWITATIEMPSHENCYLRGMIDAEAHHGITPANKPTDDEPEDLYALALKADNLGQP